MEEFRLRNPKLTLETRGIAQDLTTQITAGGESRGVFTVGVFPFDEKNSQTKPRFIVPKEVNFGPVSNIEFPNARQEVDFTQFYELVDWAKHESRIEKAIAALRVGQLDKVVLAERIDFPISGLDIEKIYNFLSARDQYNDNFCITFEEQQTLIGSTPEVLVEKKGRRIYSHPLAGSLPRQEDETVNEARGKELQKSPKNTVEHRYVVSQIESVLSPYCEVLDVPRTPQILRTSQMLHLGTPIVGELKEEYANIDVNMLAQLLHPTPAVCGTPTEVARQTIADLEGYDRGYYAGALGWSDERGDGRWLVSIRCANLDLANDRAQVYAGGGIVANSVVADEIVEVKAKLKAILAALCA